MKTKLILALALLGAAAAWIVAQRAPTPRPGPQTDGSAILPNGWRIKPAGQQVALGHLPMSTAATKQAIFVLNGGYMTPSVTMHDPANLRELRKVTLPDAWLGLALTPDQRKLYVGGGSQAAVYELEIDSTSNELKLARTFPLVDPAKRQHQDFTGDVALSPDGRLLYVAMLHRDTIAVINPQSGMVIERFKTGRRPYRILFHPDGQSFYVSSWADAAVWHHDTATGRRLDLIRTGPHPTDMLISARRPQADAEETINYKHRLFVAAANTNRVHVFGIAEDKAIRPLEAINTAFYPDQPVGMTPSALALTPDEKRLYIVCSDANAIAVADVSASKTQVDGFIPTGWYPVAARATADGRLLAFNGRGARSFPNPNGPNPTKKAAPVHQGNSNIEYVGRLQNGSVSIVPPFDDKQLDAYSRTVLANALYKPSVNDNPAPLPAIQHVVYIVKENRTYDQVLGDLGRGNGDPSLTLFDATTTPNHRKLANEFVLLDNFYVNADVSADGHNWSTSAIANDYVQKMWPNSYGGRRKHYDYEGGEPAALPPAGYLWSNAQQAGITMRNYGWWATNDAKPAPGAPQIKEVRDSVLAGVTNRNFRAFDLDYLDIDRAKVFLADLAEFEKSGNLPRLIFIRIGNDHTSATAAGKYSPKAAMADNDWALGMIVEGLSKSRFWPNTAIFVLEDDAQNGPDHIDSHRSPAYVLSPYTRRGGHIDSTFYNTTSMLRTMELLLGIKPMTHFDASAIVMYNAFAAKPDPRPYTAEKPAHPIDERNPGGTNLAARAAKLDLDEADEIDDHEMNALLWLAIRQTDPPAPTRSIFGR